MPEFKKLDLEGKPTIENPIFSLAEAVCISWFTIEYFLRLAGWAAACQVSGVRCLVSGVWCLLYNV